LEGGIKIDLRDIGWEGVQWIHLAQDRERWWALVNTMTKPLGLGTMELIRHYLVSF
jgi:hypothetical protein